MDEIYNLYCKILEQKSKIEDLVSDDDGVILKMHKDILFIQFETLLNLLDKENVRLWNEYNNMWQEKFDIYNQK